MMITRYCFGLLLLLTYCPLLTTCIADSESSTLAAVTAETTREQQEQQCMSDKKGECARPPDADSSKSIRIPDYFELWNGVRFPLLAFGTAGLGERTKEAVNHAILAGFKHIDSAQAMEWYREDLVSEAVLELEPDARKNLFITSKLLPREFQVPGMEAALQKSLDWFKVQALDLFLLHYPGDDPAVWKKAWMELVGLHHKGRVRAIGISNFGLQQLQQLEDEKLMLPHVVQNWADPFHQDTAVRAWCQQRGILYTAYSTFGDQWVYAKGLSQSPVPTNAVLQQIAQTHNTSVYQVTLSWALQNGMAVLPRSANQKHIAANAALLQEGQLAVFLSDADLRRIDELDGQLD